MTPKNLTIKLDTLEHVVMHLLTLWYVMLDLRTGVCSKIYNLLKSKGKNHNLMVQHGRVCLKLSQNFQSIIHTKRKYKCKGQGCCLEGNQRIGIWSNEVKNLTWLVNSSIMYEPPQIVCMAPFFCTRKAITETLLPTTDEDNSPYDSCCNTT